MAYSPHVPPGHVVATQPTAFAQSTYSFVDGLKIACERKYVQRGSPAEDDGYAVETCSQEPDERSGLHHTSMLLVWLYRQLLQPLIVPGSAHAGYPIAW